MTDDLLAHRVKGRVIEEGVIQIDRHIPLHERVGNGDLAGAQLIMPLPGEPAARRRCLYFDTETTGLSGGSGTLAFLIGCAVVEPDGVLLRQFLLTRFAAEAGMLAAFAALLCSDDKLVSYNGKSYDLPLLQTRFRMQGIPHPFAALAHLDLLHPTRRLFARRWPDCRLTTLEVQLLGFQRVNDLPGAEAPAAWFDYLRQGRVERLLQVVEHNQQDIISLVAAHQTLSRAITQPLAYDVDTYALARWLSETDEAAARRLLSDPATPCCSEGQRLLARLARRAGNWTEAIAIWQGLSAGGCAESIEHLAKYHEHVSHDLAKALRYCERLPVTPAQQHRLGRLKKRAQQGLGSLGPGP